MIKDFLEILHGRKLPEEYIEIRTKTVDGVAAKAFFKSTDAAVKAIEKTLDKNVWVGIQPRASRGGKKEDVANSYWLYADLDNSKIKTVSGYRDYVARRFCLPPTLIINSGGGQHFYWAVETLPPQVVIALCSEISDKLHSDRLSDPSRVFRVPGTLNYKYDPPVEASIDWVGDLNAIYTADEVTSALLLPSDINVLIQTGALTKYDSRSERDYAVLGAMVKAGFTDLLIKYIFENTPIGDKAEDNGPHYLEQSIKTMREKEGLAEGERAAPPSKWGIIEKDGCYYKVLPDGGLQQISTFIFHPDVLLEGDDKKKEVDTLYGTITAMGKEWRDVTLSKKAFVSADNMAKELPKATWQWLGRDPDVKKLLPYLLEKLTVDGEMPTKIKTSVLGRHNDLFVLDGQVIGVGGLVEDANITWLPSGKDLPTIRFKPEPTDVVDEHFRLFMKYVFNVNELDVILITLGWFTACLYKPVLEKQGVHFPMLNVYGTRGAGKTTLLTDVMQRLFGYEHPRTYDSNTTRFVMLSLLGCSNSLPLSFSEYRRSSMRDADQLPGYIRLSYDGGFDSRGRADQSMVDYPLTSAFTVDGEDNIEDPACKERTIQLNLKPETIVEGGVAYEALQKLAGVNLNCIGFELVKYSLAHEIDFTSAYAKLREEFPSSLPDRVRRNFSVVFAGLQVFASFIAERGYSLELKGVGESSGIRTLFDKAIGNVVDIKSGRTTLPVDEFITDVINFIEYNQGQDQFIFDYNRETAMLALHLKTAHNWWSAKKMQRRESVLDLAAIKNQLRERLVDKEKETFKTGDYVMEIKATHMGIGKGTHRAYIISLLAAHDAGLDVPTSIQKFGTVKVTEPKKQEAKT